MATPAELKIFRVFLRLLSVIQFAQAIFAAAALGMIALIRNDAAARAADPVQGAELFALENRRMAFIGLTVLSIVMLVGSVASGICLWHRRRRGFSLVMAVASLLFFPVGTLIGAVTLVVLGQKPMRDLYGS